MTAEQHANLYEQHEWKHPTQVAGIPWKNPVATASGTFQYAAVRWFYDVSQLGAVTTKGVSPVPWEGNPGIRTAEGPSSNINAVGLQNPGVDHYLEDDLPKLKAINATVIANVAGHCDDDYAEVVSKLDDSPADMLEINVSCPNVSAGGMSVGTDPVALSRLITRLRKLTDKKMIVKLTPNVTDITVPARAAVESGADALSLINTLLGMRINIRTGEPVITHVTGGVSGEDHVARGRGGRQTGEVPDPGPALHVFALGRVHKNLQVEPGQHAVQRMTGPGPDFCQHRQHGAAEQRGAIQQAARKITGDALVQTGEGRTVPSHGSLLCLQPDAYRLGLLIIVGETPLAARGIAAGGLHGHTDTQVPWLHTLHADTQGADMPLPGQPGQRLFRILPGTGHHAIQIFLPPEQPEPGTDALQRLLALGIGQAVSPPASPVAGHAHTLIGQGIVVMCPCVRKKRDDHRRHQAIVALQVGQRPGEQSVEQAVLLVEMQTDIHAILPRGWPSYRSRPVRPYAHAGSGRRHRHCFADPAKPRCRR